MILANGRIFVDGAFHEVDIKVENGLICEIGRNVLGEDRVDVKQQLVFPGFIDTHIHGAFQVNCGDSAEAMKRICRALPRYGVTSFTPTPIATSIEASVKAVRNIRQAKAEGCSGSDILGIFLYTAYKNRSIPYYGKPVYPSKEHTLQLVDEDLSDIFSILFAPELDQNYEWLDWIKENGVLPVIGFTEGKGNEIYEAVKRGAVLTDHFYNGFPPLDHHEDVSTANCLLADGLHLQLNCDTIHVAVPFIKLAIKVKGIKHILPVSDSSKLVGMPEGEYNLDGMKVFLKNGAVRDCNGKLVTGAHSYDENMRALHKNGFSLEDIGILFTENAANILGLTDRGKIEVGRRADLVVMDNELNVCKTYIKGELCFEN